MTNIRSAVTALFLCAVFAVVPGWAEATCSGLSVSASTMQSYPLLYVYGLTLGPGGTPGASPMAGNTDCTIGGSGASPAVPAFTKPGTYTEVLLDVATTATANTAVTALIAGHRSAGGWITNPVTATTVICVNTITTAAFTSGACVGSNNGILPGQSFNVPPNANTVSVVSSDASHAFSGEGLQ